MSSASARLACRRLTEVERAERRLSGGDLQAQITNLAELLGWSWCHWRAAPTRRGYRVPVEGPLGAGWPDIFLAHPRRGRLLAIEVKRELGDPITPAQETVHELLGLAGLMVVVARPSDLRDPIETSRIYELLR